MGAMTNQVKAQSPTIEIRELPKTSLSFDLRAFTSYNISLDGKHLTFTPDELFAAMEPCQHEAETWGMGDSVATFRVNNRTLDVCKKCATWFWRDGR
jgi:hypothetical protein